MKFSQTVFSLPLLLATLVGCSINNSDEIYFTPDQVDEQLIGTYTTLGSSTAIIDEPTIIDTQYAIASLPAEQGEEIVAVSEQKYRNAVEQYIYLNSDALTPGESYFNIRLFSSHRNSNQTKTLQPLKLSSATLTKELRKHFSLVNMRISPLYNENRYGPFNYALGKGSGKDLCIYAWQAIKLRRQSGSLNNVKSIDIRFRHCKPDASEETLVGLFRSMRLSSYSSRNRRGTMY